MLSLDVTANSPSVQTPSLMGMFTGECVCSAEQFDKLSIYCTNNNYILYHKSHNRSPENILIKLCTLIFDTYFCYAIQYKRNPLNRKTMKRQTRQPLEDISEEECLLEAEVEEV